MWMKVRVKVGVKVAVKGDKGGGEDVDEGEG